MLFQLQLVGGVLRNIFLQMSPGPSQVAPVFLLGVGISSGQGVQVV